jgi:hypothetical protein
MARWFRSYADKLDNPKVQRLSDAHYRAWDSLLCVACKYDGRLPPLADLAFLLRRPPPATAKLVDVLMRAGLFVKTERGIEPHDWNIWQYKSDVSTDRVKQHRQRQRNVSAAASATPSESEPEPESENRREAPSGLPDSDGQASRPVAARGSLKGSAHDRERGGERDGERNISIPIKRMPS